MRNRGPGQWRQWHYGNITVPLYMPDPKVKPPPEMKPLNEVAHMTMRAMMAKNSLPKLTDAINEMIATPDSPGGRISEQRFRDTLKDTAKSVLPTEDFEVIFPPPPPPEEPKRRGSKRRPSMSKEAPPLDADKEG
mmetsp:Transcript_49365/g.86962  ORF Transcript_49365/g.86962 Transcript_49365/m.86962 type:complete len:135 (+) Transcript_49365:51-455(+)